MGNNVLWYNRFLKLPSAYIQAPRRLVIGIPNWEWRTVPVFASRNCGNGLAFNRSAGRVCVAGG
jgi:hypothetical protein